MDNASTLLVEDDKGNIGRTGFVYDYSDILWCCGELLESFTTDDAHEYEVWKQVLLSMRAFLNFLGQ